MAAGLKKLLTFNGDVENTFCRTFSVEYTVFGAQKVFELKENGSNITLTNENRHGVLLYILYIIHHL